MIFGKPDPWKAGRLAPIARAATARSPRALPASVLALCLLLPALSSCTPKGEADTIPTREVGKPVTESGPVTSPALNWVLPIFTDREGYRSMTLRGSEVRAAPDSSIAVTDLSITIFTGTAEAKVDSILLSPSATFFPKKHRATGKKSLRFIQDTIEVTGEDWTYDHDAKKVSINNNVRVTFRAQINDILK